MRTREDDIMIKRYARGLLGEAIEGDPMGGSYENIPGAPAGSEKSFIRQLFSKLQNLEPEEKEAVKSIIKQMVQGNPNTALMRQAEEYIGYINGL